jgi:hypothetical protein
MHVLELDLDIGGRRVHDPSIDDGVVLFGGINERSTACDRRRPFQAHGVNLGSPVDGIDETVQTTLVRRADGDARPADPGDPGTVLVVVVKEQLSHMALGRMQTPHHRPEGSVPPFVLDGEHLVT